MAGKPIEDNVLYNFKDLMEILDCKKSKAYEWCRQHRIKERYGIRGEIRILGSNLKKILSEEVSHDQNKMRQMR